MAQFLPYGASFSRVTMSADILLSCQTSFSQLVLKRKAKDLGVCFPEWDLILLSRVLIALGELSICRRPGQAPGTMFWFSLKKLVGSYFSFRKANRLN